MTPVEHPRVSVVIPTYNYATYLARAIDSALAQTYPNVEVIVVDDGSTDNTRSLVAEYGARVRYIHQVNAGLSAARNTGIRAATSEFVALLDSDDQFQPGWLAAAVQTFAGLSADYALVACRARYIDKESVLLVEEKNVLRLSGELLLEDVLMISRFYPSSVVARKAALVEAGLFDTTLRSSEDRDMWVRVAARHRIFLMPETFTLVRKHGENMSGVANAGRMKKNMRLVMAKAYHARLIPRTQVTFWLKALAVYYYQIALMHEGGDRRGHALLELFKSLLCWPLPLSARQVHAVKTFVRLRTAVRVCLSPFRSRPVRRRAEAGATGSTLA